MEGIRHFFVDKLDVRIYPTREEMGTACAIDAGNVLKQMLKEQNTASIIFASAPSQLEMLAGLLVQEGIAWDRVYAFHMDEYVGLPGDAPQNFGTYIKTRFFTKLPFKQVFYMNGESPDLNGECERYTELLRKHPVDISFLGIGENGHLAFNDPHIADFNDPLLVKVNETMDSVCRQQQVTDGWFKTLTDVPHQAITITIPGLMAAQFVYALVPGKTKQQIVKQCLEVPITPECPGSILRRHKMAQLYLDDASAVLISEKLLGEPAE
ncbi:MAG: glucosamine-6-phosphate deaminase [Anaerolineaceae bacterium]|nr:glucosamine-6-phosphate deaminase [Anaerolineaceae bacterium]